MTTGATRRGAVLLAGVFLGLSGCATAPQSLVRARETYKRAEASPAAKYSPTQLYEAKKALDKAEAEFKADSDSPNVNDRAYVARRMAEIAEVTAQSEVDRQRKAQADRLIAEREKTNQRSTQAELARLRQQMTEEERQRQMTAGELDKERQARSEAERQAAAAKDRLREVAQVREETRGTVVTLPGSLLFRSGQATLTSPARRRLNQVVDALKQLNNGSLLVEGYTDSRGSRKFNEDLSQRRAQSVKQYLTDRGIPAENIKTEGFGPDNPVASNRSAEGRANNRRVEIVVERSEGRAAANNRQ